MDSVITFPSVITGASSKPSFFLINHENHCIHMFWYLKSQIHPINIYFKDMILTCPNIYVVTIQLICTIIHPKKLVGNIYYHLIENRFNNYYVMHLISFSQRQIIMWTELDFHILFMIIIWVIIFELIRYLIPYFFRFFIWSLFSSIKVHLLP